MRLMQRTGRRGSLLERQAVHTLRIATYKLYDLHKSWLHP